MDMPRVSVIIPHLNDHERLAVCLADLQRQTYPPELVEIIVVDNGSRYPIAEIVERFPRVRASFEAERGCGSARNRGVTLSSGEILAFTDSDCRPDPRWVANAVAHLTAPRAPHILGGDILVFSADDSEPTAVELFEKVFGFEQERYVRRKHFAAGANIVTTRATFDKVGPFRDGTVPEDLDWGRRATAMGFRIAFAADVVIRHPARRSWQELRWKMDRTIYHQRNALRDRPAFRLRWATLCLLYASPPLGRALRALRSRHVRGPGQRLSAIATLFRLRLYRAMRMADYLWDDPKFGEERINV